jgi:hypothetical protein
MLRLFIGLIAYILCSRRELLLEILALRQWLNVFKAGHSRQGSMLRTESFGWRCGGFGRGGSARCHCPTGDSRRLASGRFQTVSDMALFFVDDIELSFF